MPRIEFSSPENARIELLTLMLYPDDEVVRSTARIAEKVAALTATPGSQTLTLIATEARTLLHAQSFAEMRSDQRERAKQAHVAARILASVFLMERFGLNPSINRGIHALQQYARTMTYGDGSAFPISEPKMRECWKRFAPVAPLWAAARLNTDYPFAPDRGTFTDEHRPMLLSVAAEIRAFAVGFVPKHTRGADPILDPATTWEMPVGTRAAKLNPERFPDKLAAFLRSYKAPGNSAFR